jgi:hypothetical protein
MTKGGQLAKVAAARGVARSAGKLLGVATASFVLAMILLVVHVILYVHTLLWILKISKARDCGCANDWRKYYVVYFPPIAIVLGLLTSKLGVGLLSSILLLVGWIVFIFAALGYVKKLRESSCTCATAGVGDELLHVYAYLPIIGWAMSAIVFVVMVLIVRGIARKEK